MAGSVVGMAVKKATGSIVSALSNPANQRRVLDGAKKAWRNPHTQEAVRSLASSARKGIEDKFSGSRNPTFTPRIDVNGNTQPLNHLTSGGLFGAAANLAGDFAGKKRVRVSGNSQAPSHTTDGSSSVSGSKHRISNQPNSQVNQNTTPNNPLSNLLGGTNSTHQTNDARRQEEIQKRQKIVATNLKDIISTFNDRTPAGIEANSKRLAEIYPMLNSETRHLLNAILSDSVLPGHGNRTFHQLSDTEKAGVMKQIASQGNIITHEDYMKEVDSKNEMNKEIDNLQIKHSNANAQQSASLMQAFQKLLETLTRAIAHSI